jgi:hypothetical protein
MIIFIVFSYSLIWCFERSPVAQPQAVEVTKLSLLLEGALYDFDFLTGQAVDWPD